MSLAQSDALLRAAAATILLLLAFLLFRSRRDMGMVAVLFAPLAICLTGFLAGNTPEPALRLPGAAGDLLDFLAGFTVVFLWWFCLACFDRRFRPRGAVLWVGIAWAAIAAADRGLFGPAIGALELSRLLLPIGFGIVGHLVWRLIAERPDDLVEARRDARVITSALLGGLLFVDLCVDLLLGFAWRPLPFAIAQNAAILLTALWLAAHFLAVRADALVFVGAAEPVALDGLTPLHRRLRTLIEVERIYLDPNLTFAVFVSAMGAPEKAVRSLINHDLGFDHFRTFLNHHRVGEACRRLADPETRGDKLIAIALDSGFASLPSFNRAFKAERGCSPSAWRDRNPPSDQRSTAF